MLAAVSRKSFLARTVAARLAELSHARNPRMSADLPSRPQSPPKARDMATKAATVAAALAGAHIVRVHAVRPAVEALAIADAILAARP